MKKTIFTLSLVLVTALGYSQNSKGTYFVGITNDITAPGILDIPINPSLAYYINDGLAIGSGLTFSSFNNYATGANYSYVISPFIRKYINEELFYTVGTDLGISQTLTSPSSKVLTGDLTFRSGIGYSFMLSKKIALEPVLAFQSTGFYSATSSYVWTGGEQDWEDYTFEFEFGTNNITFNLGLSLRL
jgi:hypothetical protein